MVAALLCHAYFMIPPTAKALALPSPTLPLVIQLQIAAMEEGSSACAALMKAQATASKLGLSQSSLVDWMNHEAQGYAGANVPLPAYRRLAVVPFAKHPYGHDIPFQVTGEIPRSLREALYILPMNNPLAEIEAWARNVTRRGLKSPFPPELHAIVDNMVEYPLPMHWTIGSAQLAAVCEAVKSRVLDWALGLEQAGVLGEGFQFTLTEKTKAMSVTNNFHNSVVGNIGNLHDHAQAQAHGVGGVGLSVNEVASLVAQIRGVLDALPTEKRTVLEAPLACAEAELATSNPSPSKLLASLGTIKNICEGAAGNLVASGIVSMIAGLPIS